jgi:exodeoxyribonuclease VII large subunit
MSARRASGGRPAFDPRRAKGAEPTGRLFGGKSDGGDGPRTLSVSDLTRLVKGAIVQALPDDVHVVGELSNVARPAGGHIYFTLKDEQSEVRCVMWRSSASSLKFDLTDGMEVVAVGSVDVYEPRGQYQLYVRRMDPRGVGALDLAFRQLKEKLQKEGLFDPKHKQALPKFPQRIAVVTSGTGAAVRDIQQTIERRYAGVCVMLYAVRVQGEGAAEEIADAIRRINRSRQALGGVDVMIVGRGGGSLEDLWAFNEEVVARAIFASEIPIVSAVGHEVDFTIADFVADIRAATPTAAAELVVPLRTDLIADLELHANRLRQSMGRLLETSRLRLDALERNAWFRDPIGRVRQLGQQVDEAAGRLRMATSDEISRKRSRLHDIEVRLGRVRPEALLMKRREILSRMEHRLHWAQGHLNLQKERSLRETASRMAIVSPMQQVRRAEPLLGQLCDRIERGARGLVTDRKAKLDGLEARLVACSHEQVLNRGFSITRKAKGRILIRGAKDVAPGDRVITQTADGEFESNVVDARQGELFE